MTEQFANSATTTLNGAIDNVVTSLTLTSAAAFPGSGTFRLLIDSEILLVTAVAGAVLTVTRGAESTTAAAHANGAAVVAIVTAGALAQLKADAGGATLPTTVARVTKSSNYTIVPSTDYLINLVTNAGVTVTLPASPTNGNRYEVANQVAGTNFVSGNGVNINGAATISLAQYQAITFTFDSALNIWVTT